MRRVLRVLAAVTAAAGAAGAAGCDAGERDGGRPVADSLPAPSGPPEAAPVDSPLPGDTLARRASPRSALTPGAYDTIVVYFTGPDEAGDDRLVGVPRAAPDTAPPLSFALRALLAGPTPAERERGLRSWFSSDTEGMLRSVTVDDGLATADFDDLRPVIPNATSSAGALELLGQLEATAFQFPDVDGLELRILGDCDAFMGWLQMACVPLRP